MGKLFLTAVLAAALVVPASAARADTDPGVWATRVCGTLVDWQKQIVKGGQSIGKSLQSATPKKIKAALVDYLTMVERISKTLVRRVDDAGTPDVSHGDEIRRAFHAAIAKVPGIFADARDQIAGLPTSDRQKLAQGVQTVGERLSRAADGIQTTFNGLGKRYNARKLDTAFDHAAACKGIR